MTAAALVLREVASTSYGEVSGGYPTLHVLSSETSAQASDPDRIESLGDEIATLFAHMHAADRRALVLIAEFDQIRGWERSGHRDCARWLAFRTGIDTGAAREKVRAARALAELPAISAAMARGELSFSKVRALTRIADAENEEELLELTQGATAAQVERLVRGWKQGSREDEADRERRQHDARMFSIFPDEKGMYVVRGRLTPESAALFMRALDAAGDALFREHHVPGVAETEASAGRRRAAAAGLVAERALAAGFGAAGDEASPPISGTRADRYQVVLHVQPEALLAEGEPARSELEDGTRVSAETSRRLACDAGLVEVTHRKDGSILDVGRKTRTIPPALRRALEIRDRGCRFPGCGLRFTDAHHVKHWADGGETSLENCVLLCHHHHRLIHEGGWQVHWWGVGQPVFVDPRGGTFFEGTRETPTLPDDPVAALVAQNNELGIDPDPWVASARHGRGARY